MRGVDLAGTIPKEFQHVAVYAIAIVAAQPHTPRSDAVTRAYRFFAGSRNGSKPVRCGSGRKGPVISRAPRSYETNDQAH